MIAGTVKKRTPYVEDKFVVVYEECIILRVANQRTGNVAAKPFQRIFFDSSASLARGNFVSGVSCGTNGSWNINGLTTVNITLMKSFVLTLYDINDDAIIVNWPLSDLATTSILGATGDGKLRFMKNKISFKNSFVMMTVPNVLLVTDCIPFNFFSVD